MNKYKNNFLLIFLLIIFNNNLIEKCLTAKSSILRTANIWGSLNDLYPKIDLSDFEEVKNVCLNVPTEDKVEIEEKVKEMASIYNKAVNFQDGIKKISEGSRNLNEFERSWIGCTKLGDIHYALNNIAESLNIIKFAYESADLEKFKLSMSQIIKISKELRDIKIRCPGELPYEGELSDEEKIIKASLDLKQIVCELRMFKESSNDLTVILQQINALSKQLKMLKLPGDLTLVAEGMEEISKDFESFKDIAAVLKDLAVQIGDIIIMQKRSFEYLIIQRNSISYEDIIKLNLDEFTEFVGEQQEDWIRGHIKDKLFILNNIENREKMKKLLGNLLKIRRAWFLLKKISKTYGNTASIAQLLGYSEKMDGLFYQMKEIQKTLCKNIQKSNKKDQIISAFDKEIRIRWSLES